MYGKSKGFYWPCGDFILNPVPFPEFKAQKTLCLYPGLVRAVKIHSSTPLLFAGNPQLHSSDVSAGSSL